ncbi:MULTISPECIES: ABC transporter ATP-binding protein [Bacillus]|uniref:ABC transporter ATP-binding protein n=1 Tax=Bacillus TaxID=1386 RepID=UPI0002D7E306|nr:MULTISPECIES: ATP-binding cassette domain-containing protein [Bacillus]
MNKLEGKNLSFSYNRRNILHHVDFEVAAGECVGLLGDSGTGKTTLGRLLAGYEWPSEGEILVDGKPLSMRGFCNVQLIGQHPQLAFDERMKMGQALKETGMDPTHNQDTLDLVGIKSEWLDRYPIELSGGELQRFCIARALNRQTKYLIADEMSAMLDAITQAQLWNLLLQLMKERNLGIVMITHNEALAAKVCNRIVRINELKKKGLSEK